MSFVARTHPQQGPNPVVDNRATTWEVFNPLHDRFRFTVDAAALPSNAKLPRFWTPDDDGIAQDWAGERVWCNPPYSELPSGRWVRKAAERRAELAVLLLPANRTEQAWWQDIIEPTRDTVEGPRVEFLRGRMRFINEGDTAVKPNARPPFGVCLVIWGAAA